MYALMLSDARSTLKSLGVIIVIFPGVTILVMLLVLAFSEEGGIEMIVGLTIVLFWFIYGPWYLVRGQSLKVSSQVVRAEKEKKFIIKGLDRLSDMDGLKGELSVFVHEERGALSPPEH